MLCSSPSPAVDRASVAPYEDAFVVYRRILGPVALREFDHLLSIGTSPAIFKAYFDAFRAGLQTEVRRLFDEILQIGLTNAEALKMPPVEWAEAHLAILIRRKLPLVVGWIKEACDEQNYSKTGDAREDLEELTFWKTWRMPRLVYMQPSGTATYEFASAWTREGEQHTQQLLKAFSERFIQFLEIDLGKTAGAAHVTCARRGEPKARAKSTERGRQNDDSADPMMEFLSRAMRQSESQSRFLDNFLLARQEEHRREMERIDREIERGREREHARKLDEIKRPETLARATSTSVETSGSPPLRRYRSATRRAILIHLSQKPDATDLEICRALDEDGAEMPKQWRRKSDGDRLFVTLYADSVQRNKIESMISKIRADMRKTGIL